MEEPGAGLVGGDVETQPVEAVRQVAQLEARGRLAVQGHLLQADPLTERVRTLHVEPVAAVLGGLGARDEPVADAREPEPRLDGDRDDGARLALPRRLVRGEDLRSRDQVPDAVRGRLDVGDLDERGLPGRLRVDGDGVPDRGRQDGPADMDRVSVHGDRRRCPDRDGRRCAGHLDRALERGMERVVIPVRAGRVDPLRVGAIRADLARRERAVVRHDLMVHGVDVLPRDRVTTGDRDRLRCEGRGLDAHGLVRSEARESEAGTRKGTRRSG